MSTAQDLALQTCEWCIKHGVADTLELIGNTVRLFLLVCQTGGDCHLHSQCVLSQLVQDQDQPQLMGWVGVISQLGFFS
jgi:hypothetical protein